MYNSTLYPVTINRYTPPIAKKKQEKIPETLDEQKSQPEERNSQEYSSASQSAYKSSIDYTTTNITISQVLSDFNNTIQAVGTKPELEEEVKTYLNLVEIQAQKETPSANIIKANLRSAALILDEHIAIALNKPSKVVTDWVNALLLQKIDYKLELKTNEEEVLTPPLASTTQEQQNIQKTSTQKTEKQQTPEKPQKTTHKVNKQLLGFYKYSEELFKAGDIDRALGSYQKTYKVAKEQGDKQIQVRSLLRIGYIQDSKNNIPESLTAYNTASQIANELNDINLQSKAHYNMAIIYDEVGKTEVAQDHYFKAMGLDGETENTSRQITTLNQVGNMFADKYDEKTALVFYQLAFELSKDTDDTKNLSVTLSNSADLFKSLGMNEKAIKHYRQAIFYTSQLKDDAKCADLYNQAGDIMMNLGKKDKAKVLYTKSAQYATKAEETALFVDVQRKLKAA